jgi:hypothetical protein
MPLPPAAPKLPTEKPAPRAITSSSASLRKTVCGPEERPAIHEALKSYLEKPRPKTLSAPLPQWSAPVPVRSPAPRGVLREGFDGTYICIADARHVIEGLADNGRLKSLVLMAPIGIDPINENIQTQSPVAPAVSAAGVGQALSPGSGGQPFRAAAGLLPGACYPNLPRPTIRCNAPCPCNSGLTYKRCPVRPRLFSFPGPLCLVQTALVSRPCLTMHQLGLRWG